jgi:hypothetical protein
MYTAVLILHSWLRWLVLLFGVWAVWRAFAVPAVERWSAADERAAKLFTIALDAQLLLGILVYVWLSPTIAAARHAFGAAMQQPQLRFWLVEHPVGMIAALVLAHIGRARIRRQLEPRKRRVARIFFTISLLLVLASIPWPGLPYGRALFRW